MGRPDVQKKSGGSQDTSFMLASLEKKLTPEKFARFCELTPDGQQLWDMFLEHQKRHTGPDQYGYVEFANQILAQRTP